MKEQIADLIAKTNALVNYMEENKKKAKELREIDKIPQTTSQNPKLHQEAVEQYFKLIKGIQAHIEKTDVDTGSELLELLTAIQKMVVDNFNKNKIKVISSPNNYQKIMMKYVEHIRHLRDGILPSVILFSSMSNTKNNIKKLDPNFSSQNLTVVPVPKNAKNSKAIFKNYFSSNIQKECVDAIFVGPTGAGKTYIAKLFYEFLTGTKVNRKIGGILRSQYVSAYYPRFDFIQMGGKAKICITECEYTRNKKEITYKVYEEKFIRPTVYNEESSRAHLMYSLPVMKGLKLGFMSGVPNKVFNIVDLCGIENPNEMSLRAFGFYILRMLNVDLFFLNGLFPSGASSSISRLMLYIKKPIKNRVTSTEKGMIDNIVKFIDQSDNSIKKFWKLVKNDVVTISDFIIFCILSRTMLNIKTGKQAENIKAVNSNKQRYKTAFFEQMARDPSVKVGNVGGILGKLFKNHNESLKNYTIGNYMLQMFKRCLESLYIESSLSEIKTIFKPSVKKNLTTIKNINVSAKTGMMKKKLKSRKSKKYLIGVVNPTVTNNDIRKYHKNIVNNFKNLTK